MTSRAPSALGFLTLKLEELRKERGLSFEALGKQIGYDRADLHKLEKGTKLCSTYVIGKLDGFYGTGDMLSMLYELAKKEGLLDTYNAYRRLEGSAAVLHQYAMGSMPGLLQTEAYTRTLLRTAPAWDEREVEATVADRSNRQQRLTGPEPVHYRAILDESCLRRMPAADGSEEIRAGQLARLVEVAQLPNVAIEVLPYAAGLHNLMDSNLILLWQPAGQHHAYQESSHSARLVEEAKAVAELRLSYDALRNATLRPGESLEFLRQMEACTTCSSPDPT
ncbi:Scr1 family TA system antitoxin-like transcriptional regulator [Streptomyces iconiensis]|uniref:Scr1 family TA system antitoxin-like transcriptional regulator n=1 Tax=Streptomyces iconiensis TaxID=1384038 RepID=A0ABT6ZZ17_9ACTN|nr:Scr1 family TA system antitoxin-like transcriptional regulator [Streptomyces iconiensis]MDJ1134303.1 Scr1 family TA system antitoxin-like transcriptional regulator [Streptomyces iconiensis]